MVLGHEFSQRTHVGDDLFCHGIDLVSKAHLATQSTAHARNGFALGVIGWLVAAGFGSPLADRCTGGSVYGDADTISCSVSAGAPWAARGLICKDARASGSYTDSAT